MTTKTLTDDTPNPEAERVCWQQDEYLYRIRLSRTTLFELERAGLGPECVRIGRRKLFLEPPADYLRRIAAAKSA
jgi:hypothetical protein